MKRNKQSIVLLAVLVMVFSMILTALAQNVQPTTKQPATEQTDMYGAALKPNDELGDFYPTHLRTNRYTYFNNLRPIKPWGKDMENKLTGIKLEPNEMRITFMGSAIPMARRAQKEISVFVEVGWDDKKQQPLDQFIFDLGCGVSANYQACGVGYGRMNKIFINHLHADHISDLIQAYGFGNSGDRKSPLFLWGNQRSDLKNPGNTPTVTNPNIHQNNYPETPVSYDDGTYTFCKNLREAMRWHTESQAFLSTAYESYPPLSEIAAQWGLPYVPVVAGDDPPNDANAIVPVELDWRKTGLTEDGRPTGDNIAYNNASTGAKVLHYPVIHCRKGSMAYKLEWTIPKTNKTLTMIYSSDTKPETNSIAHAINKDVNGTPRGVDVFIHEMIVPAEVWAMKQQGLQEPGSGDTWDKTVDGMITIQNSSHTPQGAYGYLLSQISPRPKLAVATHFPVADDTVACALESVKAHCPEIKKEGDKLVWSFDLMVLRVFPDRIEQRRAVVSDYSFNPPIPASSLPTDQLAPKYHTESGDSDPFYQIDRTDEILSTEEGDEPTYRQDGY
jgi:ribonuclease Z